MEQQSPDQLDVSSRVSRSSKRQEGNDIKKEIKTAGDEIVVSLLFRQPPQASGNPKEDFLFFSLSLSLFFILFVRDGTAAQRNCRRNSCGCRPAK